MSVVVVLVVWDWVRAGGCRRPRSLSPHAVTTTRWRDVLNCEQGEEREREREGGRFVCEWAYF